MTLSSSLSGISKQGRFSFKALVLYFNQKELRHSYRKTGHLLQLMSHMVNVEHGSLDGTNIK